MRRVVTQDADVRAAADGGSDEHVDERCGPYVLHAECDEEFRCAGDVLWLRPEGERLVGVASGLGEQERVDLAELKGLDDIVGPGSCSLAPAHRLGEAFRDLGMLAGGELEYDLLDVAGQNVVAAVGASAAPGHHGEVVGEVVGEVLAEQRDCTLVAARNDESCLGVAADLLDERGDLFGAAVPVLLDGRVEAFRRPAACPGLVDGPRSDVAGRLDVDRSVALGEGEDVGAEPIGEDDDVWDPVGARLDEWEQPGSSATRARSAPPRRSGSHVARWTCPCDAMSTRAPPCGRGPSTAWVIASTVAPSAPSSINVRAAFFHAVSRRAAPSSASS